MLDEDFSKCSPIHHYGRASLSSVFMTPLALLNIDDDHHFTSSIMGHMKSSFDASP
jgi:hypothetical protein